MKKYIFESKVEEIVLKKFGISFFPEYEKIKVIEVPNFPILGKIVSIRFIEWLQLNPEGVVSLPTGKTPEYFIKWTKFYLDNWDESDVKKELKNWGIDIKHKPDMKNYWFVQMDEFYPMNPNRINSFNYYIRNFYIKDFGFSMGKTILMDTWKVGAPKGKNLSYVFPDNKVDLSLRYRTPKNEIENLQQKAIYEIDRYAMDYEKKIEELGGIGFFLGGIGQDGHIAFNIRGSDHNSTTRILTINYETAATASVDLGGIENARDGAVMTIGLATICKNPTITAIIMASGESKAKVVRDAVEKEPDILYPATALQKLKGSRFYITKGAGSLLKGRRIEKLRKYIKIPDFEKEKIIIDLSFGLNKKIRELKIKDLKKDIFGKLLLEKEKLTERKFEEIKTKIEDNLKKRIYKGLAEIENKIFLHTEPHHDDIMLGYFPYLIHLVRKPTNKHYFVTLTSGFTSVTNKYLLEQLENLEKYIEKKKTKKFIKDTIDFEKNNDIARNMDISLYLDGVAEKNEEMKKEAEARRMYRNIVELINSLNSEKVLKKITELKKEIKKAYPGKRDSIEVQKLKGMIREWEVELLWAHLGFRCENIYHLRLGFYTGEIFTPQPEWERDIKPFIQILEKTKPDIITVALDPEGTGPDTHYKCLQIISQGLKEYIKNSDKSIKIWGYRNVWYRFHPSEVNIYVPVSMNNIAIIRSAFDICFGSQRSASFPSYEYDGPFSELAIKIMVEQGRLIKTVIGNEFFIQNEYPRLRASRGINFIKEMEVEEFWEECKILKNLMED